MIGGWLSFTRRNIVHCVTDPEATDPEVAVCHDEVRNGLHGLPDMFSRLSELETLLVD